MDNEKPHEVHIQMYEKKLFFCVGCNKIHKSALAAKVVDIFNEEKYLKIKNMIHPGAMAEMLKYSRKKSLKKKEFLICRKNLEKRKSENKQLNSLFFRKFDELVKKNMKTLIEVIGDPSKRLFMNTTLIPEIKNLFKNKKLI